MAEAPTDLELFRGLFWEAFAPLKAKTDRYDELRADLELGSDILAGPMHSLFEGGECDYVFDDPSRFPGVANAESFLEWCLAVVSDFRKIVVSVRPSSVEEQRDCARYLEIADKMEQLSRIAYRIVKKRGG